METGQVQQTSINHIKILIDNASEGWARQLIRNHASNIESEYHSFYGTIDNLQHKCFNLNSNNVSLVSELDTYGNKYQQLLYDYNNLVNTSANQSTITENELIVAMDKHKLCVASLTEKETELNKKETELIVAMDKHKLCIASLTEKETELNKKETELIVAMDKHKLCVVSLTEKENDLIIAMDKHKMCVFSLNEKETKFRKREQYINKLHNDNDAEYAIKNTQLQESLIEIKSTICKLNKRDIELVKKETELNDNVINESQDRINNLNSVIHDKECKLLSVNKHIKSQWGFLADTKKTIKQLNYDVKELTVRKEGIISDSTYIGKQCIFLKDKAKGLASKCTDFARNAVELQKTEDDKIIIIDNLIININKYEIKFTELVEQFDNKVLLNDKLTSHLKENFVELRTIKKKILVEKQLLDEYENNANYDQYYMVRCQNHADKLAGISMANDLANDTTFTQTNVHNLEFAKINKLLHNSVINPCDI
jgi:hypothetical protein